jgi:hypothetical protein
VCHADKLVEDRPSGVTSIRSRLLAFESIAAGDMNRESASAAWTDTLVLRTSTSDLPWRGTGRRGRQHRRAPRRCGTLVMRGFSPAFSERRAVNATLSRLVRISCDLDRRPDVATPCAAAITAISDNLRHTEAQVGPSGCPYVHSELADTKGGICVSTVSIVDMNWACRPCQSSPRNSAESHAAVAQASSASLTA